MSSQEVRHYDVPASMVWSGSSLSDWDGSKSHNAYPYTSTSPTHATGAALPPGTAAHHAGGAGQPGIQGVSASQSTSSVGGAGKDKLVAFYGDWNRKPSDAEALQLSRETGLSTEYINRWFSSRLEQNSSPAQSKRTNFTQAQTMLLEETFLVNPYPSTEERMQLAQRLQLETKVVDNWFHNKRARSKRM